VFDALTYDVAMLPSGEDARCLLLALSVRKVLESRTMSLADAASMVGATVDEVERGVRFLRLHGVDVLVGVI